MNPRQTRLGGLAAYERVSKPIEGGFENPQLITKQVAQFFGKLARTRALPHTAYKKNTG